MKKCFSLLGLLTIILLIQNSCKNQPSTQSGNSVPDVEKVVINPGFTPPVRNTDLEIHNIMLTAPGIVEIAFSYSGGCKKHHFSLYSTGKIKNTPSKTIHFYLINHQKEDPCRQLIADTLKYDISGALPKKSKGLTLVFNDGIKKSY